jgi:geranylgeranyl pyrophosphate synthase/predicted secreted hydrolase
MMNRSGVRLLRQNAVAGCRGNAQEDDTRDLFCRRGANDTTRSWAVPSDWPAPGAIDLQLHDRPHLSSDLEWWYFNAHLELDSGEHVGVFAAFFRKRGISNKANSDFTHSVAWGISRGASGQLLSKVVVDSEAARIGLETLELGLKGDDERVERALGEALAKGRVPGPTRTAEQKPEISLADLSFRLDDDALSKDPATGEYVLSLSDDRSKAHCHLRFRLEKEPIRYGDNGIVSGVGGEHMFYYFVPRAQVSGDVELGDQRARVVRGSGWYDHEFGVVPEPAQDETERTTPQPGATERRARQGETCWRWLSIQLDNGDDLSVYFITRRATGEVLDRWAMLSRRDGTREAHREVTLTNLELWRSTRTFIEYPVRLAVSVPFAGCELTVEAEFRDQEVITILSDPSFWEGRILVKGTMSGAAVAGRGWLECKGFGHSSLDEFYSAVGREVRGRLSGDLPMAPAGEGLCQLMVRGKKGSCRTDFGVDGRRLGDSLTAPIRAIADRGGKGWRSYAALACIDAVGGDSRKFIHWLIQPEVVHVGSLIVDDVEDESNVRRGGPSCHLLFGTAQAINAGTAAYFLAEPPLDQDDLPDAVKLEIYRLYFDAMRAGHAGQALDLHDVSALGARAAQTGDIRELERHVLSVHRLKTGVPAGMFARTGALLGGGSREQVMRVGEYFEAIGLAFQVIDDVLNVSGFEGNLKQRGEDITAGKFTLPIVKALGRLGREERLSLWRSLSMRSSDPEVIRKVGNTLLESGALLECRLFSHQVVQDAWKRLDPVLTDSQFKIMFRAFGWYVLERHY